MAKASLAAKQARAQLDLILGWGAEELTQADEAASELLARASPQCLELYTESPDADPGRALHWAARANSERLCRVFLELGAKPLSKRAESTSPFEIAALYAGEPVAELFGKAVGSLDINVDGQGHTPLMLAVYGANPAACRAFLRLGADPNYAMSDKRSAAHVCAYSLGAKPGPLRDALLECVDELARAGADFSLLDGCGFTAERLARHAYGQPDLADAMRARAERWALRASVGSFASLSPRPSNRSAL